VVSIIVLSELLNHMTVFREYRERDLAVPGAFSGCVTPMVVNAFG
jgi:hypothetical protein